MRLVSSSHIFTAALLIICNFQHAHSQVPELDTNTNTLTIPILKADIDGETLYAEVVLVGSEDLNSFSLKSATLTNGPSSIDLSNTIGSYETTISFHSVGDNRLKSPFSTCSVLTNPTTSDLDITVEGNQLQIIQDSFFQGECRFSADISAQPIGGSYSCSDFSTGEWELKKLQVVDEVAINTLLTVHMEDCSHDRRFIGTKLVYNPEID